MMQLRLHSQGIALAAVVVGGCDASQVTDGQNLQQWRVERTPRFVVGALDGPDEYVFGRVADGALLGDGGVVVADLQQSRLLKYDSAGEHQQSIGGRGEGPGEFEGITNVWTDGSSFGAFDSRLARFTLFDSEGRRVRTTDVSQSAGRANAFAGRLAAGDLVVGWLRQGDSQGMRADSMVFARFAENGEHVENLGDLTGFVRVDGRMHPYSPMWSAAVFGDRLFLTDGVETLSEIELGGTPRTLELPDPRWSPEELTDSLRALLRAESDTAGLARLDEFPPRVVPAISRMLVDDLGQLWLKLFDPAVDPAVLGGFLTWPGGAWVVLDPTSGDIVAEVAIPDDLMLMDVRGSRVLGLTRDGLGVERVRVYGFDRGGT